MKISTLNKGLFLSQRKYVFDLLKEINKLGPRPAQTPMETNNKLGPEQGEPLSDTGHYQMLVGKLIYLPIIRLDISFTVSMVSQFMYTPHTSHLEAIDMILRILKDTPDQEIWMMKNETNDVVSFSDVDWANNYDRKSTHDFILL
jgi:hypothetical protein